MFASVEEERECFLVGWFVMNMREMFVERRMVHNYQEANGLKRKVRRNIRPILPVSITMGREDF